MFARYYDLEYDRVTADLNLYLQFAVEAGGPVLELGCGSGRVLRALERTGLPLTGLDSSLAMLKLARERVGPTTELIQADMRRAAAEQLAYAPYWLAICAINTFLHLPDTPAQFEALRGIREVVVDGGLLLIDLMSPDPTYLASLDGRMQLEFSTDLPGGDRLDKWVVRTCAHDTQTIDTTVWFDVTDGESGVVTRSVDHYLTRYLHRYELELLLAAGGWELLSLYGGYELGPYDAQAERMIALATTAPAATGKG